MRTFNGLVFSTFVAVLGVTGCVSRPVYQNGRLVSNETYINTPFSALNVSSRNDEPYQNCRAMMEGVPDADPACQDAARRELERQQAARDFSAYGYGLGWGVYGGYGLGRPGGVLFR